jgi:DNA-binding SARP family transcriptional activator
MNSLPSRIDSGERRRSVGRAAAPTDAADVRLSLLGGFSLRAGDQVLLDERWPRSRAKAILKLLGIAPGHRLHREQVIDLVWPDLPLDRALDQLYKTVHFIRSETARDGMAPIVRTAGERIEVADGVTVDVDRFRELAMRVRATGEWSLCREALAAYAGDLLPDDRLEEWTEPAREELAALARDLRLDVLRADEERGDAEAAIESARSILRSDPASEPAHRALMRVLAASGDRAGAIRQYHRCLEALRRELDVEPSVETESLYRTLLEEGIAARGAGRSAAGGGSGEPPARGPDATLLEELGDVTRRKGEVDRSVLLYEETLAQAQEEGDMQSVLRLRGKAALAHILRGDLVAASGHLSAARRAYATVMPEAYSAPLLHYLLAQLRWHGGRYDDALRAAERAVEEARFAGDPRREAEACEVLALSCHALGDWRRGIEAEVRRQELAVDDGFDAELSLEGHLCLWEYHLYGDRPYARVETSVRGALAQAEAVGNVQAMGVCEHALGALHFVTGRWRESDEELSRSIRLANSVGAELASIVGRQRLGRLKTARGKLDEGLRDLELAMRGANEAKHPPTPRHSRTRILASLAQNRLQAGEVDAARGHVEAAIAAQTEFGRCVTCDSLLNPVAVEVYLAAGDLDRAQAAADEADLTAAAFGSRSWLATADLARAMVLAARHSLGPAERMARRAATTFEQLGQPYDLARSLALVAQVESRAKRRRSSGDAARRARSIFAALGAAPGPTRLS